MKSIVSFKQRFFARIYLCDIRNQKTIYTKIRFISNQEKSGKLGYTKIRFAIKESKWYWLCDQSET